MRRARKHDLDCRRTPTLLGGRIDDVHRSRERVGRGARISPRTLTALRRSLGSICVVAMLRRSERNASPSRITRRRDASRCSAKRPAGSRGETRRAARTASRDASGGRPPASSACTSRSLCSHLPSDPDGASPRARFDLRRRHAAKIRAQRVSLPDHPQEGRVEVLAKRPAGSRGETRRAARTAPRDASCGRPPASLSCTSRSWCSHLPSDPDGASPPGRLDLRRCDAARSATRQCAKNCVALSRWVSARAAQSVTVSMAASRLRGPPLVSAMRGVKNVRAASACSRSQKLVTA